MEFEELNIKKIEKNHLTRITSQNDWRRFSELLNELRKEEKLTAQKRRNLASQWRNTPEKRVWILQHLKVLEEGDTV